MRKNIEQKIVNDYAKFLMELQDWFKKYPSGLPISILPHPKEEIRKALESSIKSCDDEKTRQALSTSLSTLVLFRPDEEVKSRNERALTRRKQKIDIGKTNKLLPVSFKQDFINHFIWLIIINSVFAYFGNRISTNEAGTVGLIVWPITGFFMFGMLFTFTKLFKRKFDSTVLSFILSLVFMLTVNFVLVLLIP